MTNVEKLKEIAKKYGTEIKEPIEIGSTGHVDHMYCPNTYGYDKNGRFVYILPILSVKKIRYNINNVKEIEEKSWNTLFQRYVGNEDLLVAACDDNNNGLLVSAPMKVELENLVNILEGETLEYKRIFSTVSFSL